MKFFVPLVAALISFSQAAALAIESRDSYPPATCGNAADAIGLLRAFSSTASDHFYTTNAAEMNQATYSDGYTAEGTAALVFGTQETGTAPLYRLYSTSATDHFYTMSAAERDNAVAYSGYANEGIAAYIYPTQICGSIPLFRAYSASGTDHFYTTNAAERDNAVAYLGYANEGIAGYVLQA